MDIRGGGFAQSNEVLKDGDTNPISFIEMQQHAKEFIENTNRSLLPNFGSSTSRRQSMTLNSNEINQNTMEVKGQLSGRQSSPHKLGRLKGQSAKDVRASKVMDSNSTRKGEDDLVVRVNS